MGRFFLIFSSNRIDCGFGTRSPRKPSTIMRGHVVDFDPKERVVLTGKSDGCKVKDPRRASARSDGKWTNGALPPVSR